MEKFVVKRAVYHELRYPSTRKSLAYLVVASSFLCFVLIEALSSREPVCRVDTSDTFHAEPRDKLPYKNCDELYGFEAGGLTIYGMVSAWLSEGSFRIRVVSRSRATQIGDSDLCLVDESVSGIVCLPGHEYECEDCERRYSYNDTNTNSTKDADYMGLDGPLCFEKLLHGGKTLMAKFEFFSTANLTNLLPNATSCDALLFPPDTYREAMDISKNSFSADLLAPHQCVVCEPASEWIIFMAAMNSTATFFGMASVGAVELYRLLTGDKQSDFTEERTDERVLDALPAGEKEPTESAKTEEGEIELRSEN